MDLKKFEFIAVEAPSSISDIREALDLLSSSIDNAIVNVGEKVKQHYDNRNFKRVAEISIGSEDLNEVNNKIQNIIGELDKIIDNLQIDETNNSLVEEVEEKNIPNYSEYLVDSEIEHNLYEDLTYKRPCAFMIEGKKIEVKDWKGALVNTINYLGEKDPTKIREFVDMPKMNGKKVIYFSREKLSTMRAPRKIESANIYIETNLSANGIRNLLIKILNKYNIKLTDYKIFLKADYSELH